jgi:DNA-binding transcriptional ArsR family regulator
MTSRIPSEGQPAPLHTITTLEALKVFSDPLRQQIIEALLDSPKTVKQVASELELAPTKLYYHVNLLEEHKLIRVTETRIVSGIIEKHYLAAAREYWIERSLLTPGQNMSDEGLEIAFDAIIEPIRTDLHKSLKQGLIDTSEGAPEQHKLRMWRAMSHLSEEQAAAFYARLETLIDEFNDFKDNASADDQHYGLLIGIYPATSPRKTPKA